MQRLPEVMAWLDAGVPLTLGIDLLDPAGPDSPRILNDEHPTAEGRAWLRGIVGHAPQPTGDREPSSHHAI